MKRIWSTLTACGASLLLIYGTSAAQTPAPEGPAGESREAAASQTTLAEADQQFIEKAGQSNHMELAASIAAARKAQNADVQAFAEQIIKDHTEADKALTALATAKAVQPVTEPSNEQKQMLDALNEHEADAFDREYVKKVGVEAHEKAVKLFERASEQAQDADLKAYAEATLPKLQHHLEMAKKLQASLAK